MPETFRVEVASGSRSPFEFTDTPFTPLPDAVMVPPNETMCAPETTVRHVARLFATFRGVEESLEKAFALLRSVSPRCSR